MGSIHTEMTAILEDRSAPLYNRTTDEIELPHLEIGSILEILREHGGVDSEYTLFLWNLFEGVPKFYRDCFEQGVLGKPRPFLLKRIFFESSSPLKNEADNWFLRELHGRYDAILKYIARHPGCFHNDLLSHVREISEEDEQVAGYLQTLVNRYRIVEKRLPIFAASKARSSRYYITDNFLKSWLGAISAPVAAVNFSPVDILVQQADERLKTADERLKTMEGTSFEKLVGILYEERSRKNIGDLRLTKRISGFWDRGDTEIDLVALDEENKIIRFGDCKRSEKDLVLNRQKFCGHVERFLKIHRKYKDWRIEKTCMAPKINKDSKALLTSEGLIVQDLAMLFEGL